MMEGGREEEMKRQRQDQGHKSVVSEEWKVEAGVQYTDRKEQ